jgi:hypothetical protein
MEQSVTRVSGMGKVARVLLVALLSFAGLTVLGVGQAYGAAPVVKTLTPATGPADGGPALGVVIAGTGFTAATSVTFGGVPATAFTVVTSFKITATPPAAVTPTAAVHVVVTVAGLPSTPFTPGVDLYTYTWPSAPATTGVGLIPATSSSVGSTVTISAAGTWAIGQLVTVAGFSNPINGLPNGVPNGVYAVVAGGSGSFTINNPAVSGPGAGTVSPTSASAVGPPAGGTSVIIRGNHLGGASGVSFGATPATSFTVNSNFQITAIAPAHVAGAVDVTVTTPNSTSSSSPTIDAFSYVGPPAVTGITSVANPAGGPTGGGTQVTVTGSGFDKVTGVAFGAVPATSFLVNGLNSINATAPAGSGTADITVTAGGITSPITSADHYTYNGTLTVIAGNASYSNSPGTNVPVTATSQSASTVTITATGAWTTGGLVALSGFANGLTAGNYTIQSGALGSFTVTFAPVLSGSGTGTVRIPSTATPASVTGTSQTAGVVTVSTGAGSPAGTWFQGQVVYLTGFANGLTTGNYLVTSGTFGSFTVAFAPVLSGSGTGTAIPYQALSFNVATLVTGGGTINPASVAVTVPPASGSLTVVGSQLIYVPAQSTPVSHLEGSNTVWNRTTSTTGVQTATFQICQTAPSASCATGTMSFAPSAGGFYVGNQLHAAGVAVAVVNDTGAGIVVPASAASGSTFTSVTSPPEADLPAVNSGFTVSGIGGYRAITPVPTGLSLVAGSLQVTGGDTFTTGKFTATLCTAAIGFVPNTCTANQTGNFHTTFPYIETSLNVGILVPGGSQLSLPTVSATWHVDAASGTVSSVETEFVVVTSVVTIGTLVLDAYPTDLASYLNQGSLGQVPTYVAPSPRWSVNITGGGATAPGAPTGVSASAGNASAAVSWTAPASNGGSAITSYTVTSAPGALTCSSATSPCTVSGLTNGTAYTFTVKATNVIGTGVASAASAPVTPIAPATAPGAPTGVSASAGNASAVVSWTAPASDGGSAITSYTVTSAPGALTCSSATSPCTVSGLTNGTAYTFTVKATNVVGTGAASAASAPVTPIAPATAPGAPTGASASAGNASAVVSWTAPASDGGSAITSYTVTSAPGALTCSSATSPCTVSGLTNGTAYTFTVKATNFIGTGVASVASSPVTPTAPATAPGAPTGVSASAGNASAVVSWTAPASDGGSAITGYTVTSAPGALTCSSATSPCTVSGLTNGTAYTFTVTATNVVGTGAASAASSAVTPIAGVPGAPTGVSASAGNASAVVSWTAPASDGGSAITSYTVTSAPGALTCSSATSPCTVSGLTNGTAYTFTVKATNVSGTGVASASSSPVTPATVPGAPTGASASAGNASAVVSWTAPASDGGSAITGYTVTSAPGALTCSSATSPCTVSGLTNGTAYTFTVKATNVIGTGAASAASSAVTPIAGVPGAPTGVSASAGNASAVVSWTAPASDGGSAITSYTVTSAPGALTCSSATSPCTVSGLTNGTAYTFTVTATNVIGAGPLSAASGSVIPGANGPILGYWMATSGGAVLTNGAAVSYGSPAGLSLNAPIVALAPTPDRKGYWLAGSDGGVFSYGDAGYFGSAGAEHLNRPIVGMAATADGMGYWLVASDGGVFSYGDASFQGSLGGKVLNAPIVGMAGNGTGGYWLVAADGGVFAYGTASFHGSAGNLHLVASVAGIAALADGSGYYLVAADGGVFSYNAPFFGSAAGAANGLVVGITAGVGGGYTIATNLGAAYAYGTASHGSQTNSGATNPVVSIAS